MSGDLVYDFTCVANYLISKSYPKGLDFLQVLKLVYIAHGFMLGMNGRPLIEDDVEAGSSVLSSETSIGTFRAGPPPSPTHRLEGFRACKLKPARAQSSIGLWAQWHHSGLHLWSPTHRPGSPWHQVWTTYGRDAVIPRDLIETHYDRIIEEWNDAAKAGRPYTVSAL